MTKVKICGITNLEDALLAVEAGADALGFNFYRPSPRYVSSQNAGRMIERIKGDVIKLGVFVNSPVDEVVSICGESRLDVIQLHGDESGEFLDAVRHRTGLKVMKAIRIGDKVEPGFPAELHADHYLLDSRSDSYGGSGKGFDWEIARRFKSIVPEFFLAGGLTPDNVADAVRKVRPFGVDVSSGVEVAPGKKDREKLFAFIKNAKTAL